jgi:hypothetical protein
MLIKKQEVIVVSLERLIAQQDLEEKITIITITAV